MYTGIVSGMCQVLAIEDGEEIRSFVVELAGHENDILTEGYRVVAY